jgi:hypothetical protein
LCLVWRERIGNRYQHLRRLLERSRSKSHTIEAHPCHFKLKRKLQINLPGMYQRDVFSSLALTSNARKNRHRHKIAQSS